MSDIFKKCPKGHIIPSDKDECPVCKGEINIDDILENLPEIPGKKGLPDDIADCYFQGPDDFNDD